MVSGHGSQKSPGTWVTLVGLAEVDDGRWGVYLGPLKPGRLLESEMRIEDVSGKLWRHRERV